MWSQFAASRGMPLASPSAMVSSSPTSASSATSASSSHVSNRASPTTASLFAPSAYSTSMASSAAPTPSPFPLSLMDSGPGDAPPTRGYSEKPEYAENDDWEGNSKFSGGSKSRSRTRSQGRRSSAASAHHRTRSVFLSALDDSHAKKTADAAVGALTSAVDQKAEKAEAAAAVTTMARSLSSRSSSTLGRARKGKFVGRQTRVYTLADFQFRKSYDDYIENLGGPPNTMLIGPKRSGKSSYMDAHWALVMPDRPVAFWMGGGGYKAAQRRVLPCFIHEWGVDEHGNTAKAGEMDRTTAYQHVKLLWDVQKGISKHTTDRKIDPRTIPDALVDCVWDDCGQDPQWGRSSLFRSFQLAGRHNQMGQTHSFHQLTMIENVSRENIDRLGIFEPGSKEIMMSLYEYQLSGFFEGTSDTPEEDWVDMTRQYFGPVKKGALMVRRSEGKDLSNIEYINPVEYKKVEERPEYLIGGPDVHWYCQWKCIKDRLSDGRKSGVYPLEMGSEIDAQFYKGYEAVGGTNMTSASESPFQIWKDKFPFMTRDRARSMFLSRLMRTGRHLDFRDLWWKSHFPAAIAAVESMLAHAFTPISLSHPLVATLTPIVPYCKSEVAPLYTLFPPSAPLLFPTARIQSLCSAVPPSPLVLPPTLPPTSLPPPPPPLPPRLLHRGTAFSAPMFSHSMHSLAHPPLGPPPSGGPPPPRPVWVHDPRLPPSYSSSYSPLPMSSSITATTVPVVAPPASHGPTMSTTMVTSTDQPSPPSSSRHPPHPYPAPPSSSSSSSETQDPMSRLRSKISHLRTSHHTPAFYEEQAKHIKYPRHFPWTEIEKIDDQLVYQDRSLDVGDEWVEARGSGRPGPYHSVGPNRMDSTREQRADRRLPPTATSSSY